MTQMPGYGGKGKASPARIYDYLLGGKDNYAIDREAGDGILASVPEIPRGVHDNRRFLVEAVRRLAGAGYTQFLDIGAGIPTSPNVHEVAREVLPDARVVYVDNDPIVLAHTRALRADDAGVIGVAGDLRRPGEILENAEVRRTLDLDRPIVVLTIAVFHFVRDAEDPRGIVQTLYDRTAPGSAFVMSHVTASPDAWQRTVDAAGQYENATESVTIRTPDQIEELFGPWNLDGVALAGTWPEPSRLKGPDFLAGIGYH